jgi:hypothetical protein
MVIFQKTFIGNVLVMYNDIINSINDSDFLIVNEEESTK